MDPLGWGGPAQMESILGRLLGISIDGLSNTAGYPRGAWMP
jgi:hypothetical protein